MIGAFSIFGLVCAIPEMIKGARASGLITKQQKEEVKILSSGFCNMMTGVAQLTAPMYGCVTMENLGFRTTNDIIALFTLLYAVLYLYVGDGWASFGKIKLNRERLADRNERRLKR